MLRTALLLLSLTATFTLPAQTKKDPLTMLTGGKSQQWVAGGSLTSKVCKSGDSRYTFKAKPAQVLIARCTGGAWKSSKFTVTKWSSNGRSGIAFAGVKYVVSVEPPSSAICKGRAHCMCLVSVPEGTAKARTIYLTR